jgi:hypothetical protein
MEELNLYKKIQLVSNDIKNIEKNMTVGKGNYSYKAVQDIDVVLEVKKAESDHGIVSIPIKQELIKSETIKTMKENGSEGLTFMDIVKMTLRIVDIDKPSDYIDIESFGRGLDPGDKGFGKASTYARKYALLNAYKIATGEDPDKDKSKEMQPAKFDEIKDAVINYAMSDNAYLQQILSYFNVGSIEDMSKEQISSVYKNLKLKGKL